MSTLAELFTQLQEEMPPTDGNPSDEQYEQAIRDAIRDFSERCGVEQIGTLNVVAGTATYNLPADFASMIRMDGIASEAGILVSVEGLIPVASSWYEKYTIRNGRITFYPTPRYTLARQFHYKAGWIADGFDDYGGEEYSTLGEREARIVLLKAKGNLSMKMANAASGESLKYSFGAVSEDLSGTSDSFQKDAGRFEMEYREACRIYNGAYGTA